MKKSPNGSSRSRDHPARPAAVGLHLLVVIDHREARIYKTELRGSVPQRIVPYDSDMPRGSGRYLHNMGDDANGQRKPEISSFYKAIAGALKGAEKILVFGGGTGASSAMGHLLAALKAHHHELSARIVGSIVVDEHHLTEDQLLARARDYYAALSG
jgi:hypothetical protein